MNTINNNSTAYKLYTQNSSQISNSQNQSKIHHHHKKTELQDSVQFSKEGIQALNTPQKSPLADLVSNGTITQAQDDAIKNAFQSVRQANMSGTYSSKPTNPINDLVANGTITQQQADAIKSSFQSIAHDKEGTQQVSGSQGKNRIHHHHPHVQQSQNIENANQTSSQSVDLNQFLNQSSDILNESSDS